jgi:ketol-acid reductoisomerase
MKTIVITLFCAAATFFAIAGNAADVETVAVIGTGDMGDSLGLRFAGLGYRVVYGSRNPESDRVKALVKMTGKNASATTQMEAAQQADIVLTLVPVYDADDLAEFPQSGERPAPCPESGDQNH